MINDKTHGYLDIVTVIFFALAPSLFGLSETGATLSYTLAGVHLAMTLLTGFSMGVIKNIPFSFHGYVELAVGVILAGGPWIINGIFNETDRILFSVAGATILVVWLLTTYKNPIEEIA